MADKKEIERFMAKAKSSAAPETPTFRTAKSFRDEHDPIKLRTIYKVLDGRIISTKFGTRLILTIQEIRNGKLTGDIEERFSFGKLTALYTYEDTSTKALKLKDQSEWEAKQILFTDLNPYVFHWL